MTEFSAEQIKDVQLMNTIAATEELMSSIGELIKHMGTDISEALKPGAEPVDTEELEHWLELCGRALSAANKAIQINAIGYKLVRIEDSEMSSEEREELKKVVEVTEPLKGIITVLKETPEEAMMRLIAFAESLGMNLTREELDMLSGN